ncbi:MAG TPA: MerR family transcriptional regulator [Candidatus Saccharimonadaceae bacterium]|jgi:DNA-binding transcriptional MerR regulator|nr:MerR family transcriptional regulator [Candidatus Saccharimonadaceae bacterium]
MSTEPVAAPSLLRVGDLARLAGKTVRAIHLYEEEGLLVPATRSSGGFRLYDPNAVERVRWIDLLHGLGFSLHEMRELLRSWRRAGLGPDAMDQLRALFQRKLEETRTAIGRYQQLEGELKEGLRYLETCRVCATPTGVQGCAHCRQDHGMSHEPALVAGVVNAPESRRAARPGFVRIEEIG